MYRIIDSKSSGKTSRLMLLARENDIPIACSNPCAMRQKAYAYGITGIDFISYGDLFEEKWNGDIFIDEIESFVNYCIKDAVLKGYTLSNEN